MKHHRNTKDHLIKAHLNVEQLDATWIGHGFEQSHEDILCEHILGHIQFLQGC